MSGLFADERRADNRERAALLKKRIGVADALAALSLDHEVGEECPACHALGALKISKSGAAAHCESCEETFDAIGLARAARGLSFKGACDFLEAACLRARDDRTGRLF